MFHKRWRSTMTNAVERGGWFHKTGWYCVPPPDPHPSYAPPPIRTVLHGTPRAFIKITLPAIEMGALYGQPYFSLCGSQLSGWGLPPDSHVYLNKVFCVAFVPNSTELSTMPFLSWTNFPKSPLPNGVHHMKMEPAFMQHIPNAGG